jgi:undecaprenyl-diphosphatase
MSEQEARGGDGRIRPSGLLAWLGRHELGMLLTLALVVGGVWAFVALAGNVSEGDTHAFDERLLLLLRNPADHADPLGPRWVEEMMRDITGLAGTGILVLLTAGIAGYLALQRQARMALLLLLAIGGGSLLSTLLKQSFDRPRPDLVPHGVYVGSASFPSGHAMLAAVTYLTLGALLARIQPHRRLKAYLMLLAMLLTFLVGISRIYLGVHWPTDVLAGWAVGAVWALLCWLVVRRWQRQNQRRAGDTPEKT